MTIHSADALVGGAADPPWPAGALLDAVPAPAVVVGPDGRIVATNREWRALAERHGGDPERCGPGADYLAVCERAGQSGDGEAWAAAFELRRVLEGESSGWSFDYECPRPEGDQWYRMEIRPLPEGAALVSHLDTTGPQSARRRAERWLAATVERSSEATTVIGPDGRFRYASPGAAALLGTESGALLGRHSFEWVHPDDVEVITAKLDGDLARPGHAETVVLRVGRPDQGYRWIEVSPTNLVDDPDVGGIVMNGHDVTDRVLAAERQADQLAVLGLVVADRSLDEVIDELARLVERRVDGGRCVISLVDHGRIRHSAGPSVRGTFTAALQGREIGPSIGPAGVAAVEGTVVHSAELGGDDRWRSFGALASAHGFRSAWAAPATRHGDGQVIGVIAVYLPEAARPTDGQLEHLRTWAALLTVALERDGDRERLVHATTHDPLTGLGTRRTLRERLQEVLATPSPDTHAVIALDLERFNLVNDTVGHRLADQLLVRLATRLLAAIHPDDTLVRLDGDRFAVLAPRRSPPEAAALAERAVAATRHQLRVDDQVVTLGASAGVTVVEPGRADADQVLRDVDVALQHARQHHPGEVVTYDAELRRELRERAWLDAALAGTVTGTELELYHQPIVDLRSLTTVATEGLLRWRHQGQWISPIEFVPRAEATGAIVPIGRWVIDRAASDAAHLATIRPGRRSPIVCLNLSPVQLRTGDVVADVLAAASRHGVDPGALAVEITESAVLDTAVAVRALGELRALGVRVHLDDFGTGYSSLAHLQDLPLDVVKIDRHFITRLGVDVAADAVTSAVVTVADRLGLEVIAEGVETDDQLERIAGHGVHLIQGYRFAPPAPLDELRQEWAPTAGGPVADGRGAGAATG